MLRSVFRNIHPVMPGASRMERSETSLICCKNCSAVNSDDRESCFNCGTDLTDPDIRMQESKKKNRFLSLPSTWNIIKTVLITLGLVIGIPLIIGYFIDKADSGKRRARREMQYCLMNMKMLENALEMYDMDTAPPPGRTSVINADNGAIERAFIYAEVLVKGGYLQMFPDCPSCRVCKSGQGVSCDQYGVSRNTEKSLTVNCIRHGSLSNPKSYQSSRFGCSK